MLRTGSNCKNIRYRHPVEYVFCSGGVYPLADPQLNKEPLKEVMIFGASGTVGDGILKALLQDKNVQKIQVITRRLTPRIEEGVETGKVVVTRHMSYLDYAPIEDKLSNVKAVYWALGTSARNVSDAKYTEIHVDFPVAFVNFWLSMNQAKQKSLHLITGAGTGADSWFHCISLLWRLYSAAPLLEFLR